MESSHSGKPRLNLEQLREMGMGDAEFIRELADMMVDDSRTRLENMKQAHQQQDWQALGKEAHSLKGAALNVGAEVLAEMCAEAEKTARYDGNPVSLEAIQAIAAELEFTASELNRVISEMQE